MTIETNRTKPIPRLRYVWSCITLLGILALLISCSRKATEEPPFTVGGTGNSSVMKETYLQSVDQSNRVAVYEVKYPAERLTSLARISLEHRAMLEEVFPQKWRVEYGYSEKDNMALPARVPTSITIYSYDSNKGTYDFLLNRYELTDLLVTDLKSEDMPSLAARTKVFYFTSADLLVYQDKQGNTRRIRKIYFDH